MHDGKRGGNRGGHRPRIGPQLKTRLPEWLANQVLEYGEGAEVSATLRAIVEHFFTGDDVVVCPRCREEMRRLTNGGKDRCTSRAT